MFTITESTVVTAAGKLTYWLHRPDQTQTAQNALLLTFSSTRQSAFAEAPQDLPARLFAGAGHAVASFDLPQHGEQVNAFGQGIDGFCAAFCAGADPFAQFIEQGKAVIDACLAQGIGQGGIVACGVSRAAYCALRLTAADQRIRAVTGLAPVTDWRRLREFAAVRDQPSVAALALDHWAEELADRPLYLAIGNHDARVGSDACARFVLQLMAARQAQSDSPPALQFYLVDSPGHSLADEWRQAGAEFLLAQLKS
ncbi:MAG: alpha/beta hydrolase family protein [Caldilineaceae bacterium]